MAEAKSILAGHGWTIEKYRSNGRTMMAIKKTGELPRMSEPADEIRFAESIQSMSSSGSKEKAVRKVRGRRRPA